MPRLYQCVLIFEHAYEHLCTPHKTSAGATQCLTQACRLGLWAQGPCLLLLLPALAYALPALLWLGGYWEQGWGAPD